MRAQSCGRIDRMRAMRGSWGGAHSFQLILKTEDADSRKQRSKILTWDRESERTRSHGTPACMCSMEHRDRQRAGVRGNGWLRAYVSDAHEDGGIDSREHLVERLTWRPAVKKRECVAHTCDLAVRQW